MQVCFQGEALNAIFGKCQVPHKWIELMPRKSLLPISFSEGGINI